MKLVTAISTAALVLAPAIALAQAPANDAGDTKDQPGLKGTVEHMIEKITGSTPDTQESVDAKRGDRDTAAKATGNTDYPDRGAIKRTDK